MTYQDMVANVSTVTGTTQSRAEKIARAFLETLEAQLPDAEAKELSAQLPEPLRETLHPPVRAAGTGAHDAFLTEFARSAHVSNAQAPDMAKAVWDTLEQAAPEGELDDVKAVLPDDLVAAVS